VVSERTLDRLVTGRLTEITVLPASGTGKRSIAVRLPFGAAAVESPSWTPDSKRIVFFALWESPSHTPGIYSVRQTGKDMRLVLAGARYRYPALSPDGTRLAFVVDRGGNGNDSNVAVASADGSDPHLISSSYPPIHGPEWSPDGGRVAYMSGSPQGSGQGGGIVVAKADGSGAQVAVPNRIGFQAAYPSWRRAAPLPAAKRAACS
jgi:Tol biopolymer transport system component